MLVHICCSVDSHFFLKKLQSEYPDEKLIGFFYDPNIHPYSEYFLRLLDVKRSCKMLGVELIEGEYDTAGWLAAVKGLENEPEKGARCSVCFDNRFEMTAKKAEELGERRFTSTLLTSPKKSIDQLKKSGEDLAKRYNIRFIAPDYRSNQGTQEQNILAKQDKLYRQDYCGCIFGLTKQREYQKRVVDELFCPISKQIQPESIEYKVALYEKRAAFEAENISYTIKKERFVNWRLLRSYVKGKNGTIPSHILPYSTLKKGYSRGKISWLDGMGSFDRDEVTFVTLKRYNEVANTNYKDVKTLLLHPPTFEEELKIRSNLSSCFYSIGAMIVVDEKIEGKIEIFLQSEIYDDTREVLMPHL